MNNLSTTQFMVMAEIIEYLYKHLDEQPTLEQIAAHVGLSSGYVQRQFQEWVGISPKKFVQYLSLQHAKSLLLQQATILDTALDSGLSGTGRLHDLFIQFEGMTPGAYKHKGASINLNYSYEATPFGEIFVASTSKGVCSVQFIQTDSERERPLNELRQKFVAAHFCHTSRSIHQQVSAWISGDLTQCLQQKLPLCLQGTPFQLKVWEALLGIPAGQLRSYQQVAEHIGQPKAVRAVASAVANNPIAYLIPCHRVIRSTGVIGEYHWHRGRKLALLSCELVKYENL